MSRVVPLPTFTVTDITMALTREKTAADKGYTALALQTEWKKGRRSAVLRRQKEHWQNADYQGLHKFSSSSCSVTFKVSHAQPSPNSWAIFQSAVFCKELGTNQPQDRHKLPEIILTTFIRFSWSPFWCLAFFSLNEKDVWTVTTDYANIQMPIINRPYTPAGNRTVIHSNIENRITENYYRDWYDLCARSPSRQGGDKHIWRGTTNTHKPFSPSVWDHSKE